MRRFPSQCDPRHPSMGAERLNGIQTPPARLFFPDFGPPTPTSMWTYDGPLGPLTALPEMLIDFTTPPCEPQQVEWEKAVMFDIDAVPTPLVVLVEKREIIGDNPFPWDDYQVLLTIDGVASDDYLAFEQSNEFDYTPYRRILSGKEWEWSDAEGVFQTVSFTRFYPCAWDRVLPGPPFPAP